MDHALTSDELLVFAGLARWLVRLDGTFSPEERTAIDEVAKDLLEAGGGDAAGGPYRAQQVGRPAGEAAAAVDPEPIWALIERAGETLSDEPSLRKAAGGITRPEAREAIYDALFHIAASDVVSKPEWPFFDWLTELWEIDAAESGTTDD